jgi:hypothetical protein
MDEIKVLRGNGRLGAKALLVILNANRAMVRPDVAPLTLRAVICKAHDIRVSLRRQGSRSGRRFALPASMRIGDVGRAADLVRAGRIDMAAIARIVVADAHGELALCPHCSKRPATVKNTGLCEPCHKALLIARLNDAADAREALQEQWVAQQRKSRIDRKVRAHEHE